MKAIVPTPLKWHLPPILAGLAAMPLHAQLVAYEGCGEYAAGSQVESGSNGSPGTGLDGGAGWGGPYDVSNAIKSLVKIENRSSSPVNYTNGGITILGGNRALRFYDKAESTTSYVLARPLGTVFDAAAGDNLWFSILFRTATGGASPLSDQDFFQIGFDDNPIPSAGIPRVSIGSNTISITTFPSPYRFFARSSTDSNASAFFGGVDIAAGITYLLVCHIQAHAGVYDTVSLFVNPTTLDHPGTPSAESVQPSGLGSLSHAFIRTRYLDTNDAYVLDEWHVGRDYRSVVQCLQGALRMVPAASAQGVLGLRWPVSPADVVLETSATLAPDSWTEVTGPFFPQGAEWELPVAIGPETPRRFFRLRP
jgi:hypothetical protein